MVDLAHNFGARKCKRSVNFKRAIGATPEVAGEASQQPSDESSDVQEIVFLDSLEMGFHGQSASETTLLGDFGEVSLTYVEVQEEIPSKQIAGWLDKAKSTQAGCSRLLLLDRLLLNSYIPQKGQAPPMEEVSVPGLEGAQEIINRQRSFNQGESSAAHMHQLYPALLRMPVTMRAKGRGEEYVVSVPAYACKDELKQVVEDGMLIRNRNFVQSAELVCLQLLCNALVLFSSYCLILMRSFASHYDYPEYDLPASGIPVSAEGCGQAATLRLIGHF